MGRDGTGQGMGSGVYGSLTGDLKIEVAFMVIPSMGGGGVWIAGVSQNSALHVFTPFPLDRDLRYP